ncbi:MAG TPA: 30S ribosomal protein S20 [Thermoclostridium caenicola]|uniref:Small ribosomal subunit protein bS20 n=1 Tax=Thermoclostridium caenicola TaxID=659425 RepID=A0A1M6K8R5_9FIRM|nr:30S ribosomal protein S20 [Thermoclostridium caenicola]SHJ55368.1 SSU ribosomal protein S20P [Thermoclostridium caenicola]HOK44163.1 30S ribosomal protein S20 [Thermoclostridium caenicola]HOL84393.1 30S ribosomal protein S20 [Thermoclostridium caenicola]HOP71702.1 30S ribosomal protein S20 [Thermoclostridium caenicola]HPO77558.1 30S ribosomal protein S20 [Thermoclostridium caenicola]
MPNIKSAMKRVKVSRAKNLQNRMKKSELKTAIRRYREALAAKSDNAEVLLKIAIKKLDQAAAKKLIHKNAASRKKSQLMKAMKASV